MFHITTSVAVRPTHHSSTPIDPKLVPSTVNSYKLAEVVEMPSKVRTEVKPTNLNRHPPETERVNLQARCTHIPFVSFFSEESSCPTTPESMLGRKTYVHHPDTAGQEVRLPTHQRREDTNPSHPENRITNHIHLSYSITIPIYPG